MNTAEHAISTAPNSHNHAEEIPLRERLSSVMGGEEDTLRTA
jgi:hypothetical protein